MKLTLKSPIQPFQPTAGAITGSTEGSLTGRTLHGEEDSRIEVSVGP